MLQSGTWWRLLLVASGVPNFHSSLEKPLEKATEKFSVTYVVCTTVSVVLVPEHHRRDFQSKRLNQSGRSML
jgi:hypothetical protein